MEGTRNTEAVAVKRKGVFGDISLREFVSISPLLLLIFYIGLQPLPLTVILEPSVISTLQNLGNAFVR